MICGHQEAGEGAPLPIMADTPVRADHDRAPIADTPARVSVTTNMMLAEIDDRSHDK